MNAAAKAAYASVDVNSTGPCDELAQLFALSQPGNRLNVFLVDEIVSSSGNIVGMDGTIPGPSSFGGTIASGMVVSLANFGFTASCGSADPDLANCGNDRTDN